MVGLGGVFMDWVWMVLWAWAMGVGSLPVMLAVCGFAGAMLTVQGYASMRAFGTPELLGMFVALSGVRDLSLITTPPIDRLAVRTYVTPFDPMTIREALLRERYRGGQSFYVCPRIEDLAGAKEFLEKAVPEARVAVAHGQMPGAVLEDIMSAFYDGKYDVLLSTTIVESGLDIPTANTLIVHRADRFGLAQLYQLRGRVGRSKLRAYALLTLPAQQKITPQAERRLKVLQSLDTLGADRLRHGIRAVEDTDLVAELACAHFRTGPENSSTLKCTHCAHLSGSAATGPARGRGGRPSGGRSA